MTYKSVSAHWDMDGTAVIIFNDFTTAYGEWTREEVFREHAAHTGEALQDWENPCEHLPSGAYRAACHRLNEQALARYVAAHPAKVSAAPFEEIEGTGAPSERLPVCVTQVSFEAAPSHKVPSADFRIYGRRNAARVARATGCKPVAGVLRIGGSLIAEVFDEGNVQVRAGKGARAIRRLYAGIPTPAFWEFWKREKAAMKAIGLSVRKFGQTWEIAWWRKPTAKTADIA